MKVGDIAYIIVFGCIIREAEPVGVAGYGFIVRFVKGSGSLAVNRSRQLKLKDAENAVTVIGRWERSLRSLARSIF